VACQLLRWRCARACSGTRRHANTAAAAADAAQLGHRRKETEHRKEQDENRQRALIAARQGARKAICTAACKVLPFGAQVLASAAAYSLGMTATQVFGYCLRISCATPVLGPCIGALGVGFASALAGHASVTTQRVFAVGGDLKRVRWWEPMPADDVLLDSMMGVIVFKVRWVGWAIGLVGSGWLVWGR